MQGVKVPFFIVYSKIAWWWHNELSAQCYIHFYFVYCGIRIFESFSFAPALDNTLKVIIIIHSCCFIMFCSFNKHWLESQYLEFLWNLFIWILLDQNLAVLFIIQFLWTFWQLLCMIELHSDITWVKKFYCFIYDGIKFAYISYKKLWKLHKI